MNKNLNKLIFKKDKYKIILYSLIISIISLITISIIQYSEIVYNYSYKIHENEFLSKNIFVYKYGETNYVDKLKINHVVDVFDNYGLLYMVKFNGLNQYNLKFPEKSIGLVGVNNNKSYKLVKGRELDFNNTKELICPDEFMPVSMNDLFNYKVKDFIKGEYLLNQILHTEYGDFKVVGLYHNDGMFDDCNMCFTMYNDIKDYFGDGISPIVLIDNIKYKDEVIKNIESLGYDVSSLGTVDYSDFTLIHVINIAVVIFLIVILLVGILIIIKRDINYNKEEINLYRALGYTKKDIYNIYKRKYNTIMFLSTFISLIMYLIIINIIKLKLNESAVIGKFFTIHISLIAILILFFVNLLLPIINAKISIKKILRENNLTIEGE